MAVLALLSLASTVGVALFVRHFVPENSGPLVVAFFGAFLPVFAPMLCMELSGTGFPHGYLHSRITARTLTGWRTLDLTRIVRIRRYVLPGKFGRGLDLLIVTDANHVRIGLTSTDTRVAVCQALRPRPHRPQPPMPRISRKAQRYIDGSSSGMQIVMFDVFVPLILMCLWIVLVFIATGTIALSAR